MAAGYFAVTGLFAAVLGSPRSAWWPVLLLHTGLVVLLLWGAPRLPERGWIAVLRDWAPVAALPLIYAQVALLNDLFTTGYYDGSVLRAEAELFHSQPSVTLRQLLPWKPLSEYLHFGYFSYYVLLPLLGVSLYAQGRRAAFRYAVTVILAVFFFCYLCFIIVPVAGPWYVFDRPAAERLGWVFPRLVHTVINAGSSKGAAFPSSHVAAALVIWLLAWQLWRPLFWVFTALVPALIVGTVYGGFHYAVDALAGVAVGAAGYLAGPWIYSGLGGEEASGGGAGRRAGHSEEARARRAGPDEVEQGARAGAQG